MKSKKLSYTFVFIFIFLLISCESSKKNDSVKLSQEWNTNYTYVFVHGLSGWGHYDARNKFFPY